MSLIHKGSILLRFAFRGFDGSLWKFLFWPAQAACWFRQCHCYQVFTDGVDAEFTTSFPVQQTSIEGIDEGLAGIFQPLAVGFPARLLKIFGRDDRFALCFGCIEPVKICDHGSEVLIALWGLALNELLDRKTHV